MLGDPQSTAAIREAIERANRAENDLANLGVDGIIEAWATAMAPGSEGFVNGQVHSGRSADEADRAMLEAFPDYHRTWHTVVIEPPFGAVRWTTTGTHRESFMGLPPTGRKISLEGSSFFQFEDGRIRRFWVYFDPAVLVQQLRGH